MTDLGIKHTTSGDFSLSATQSQVSVRKFPYPYKAALAICSDIDETQTTDEFLEIQRFLNTRDETNMGKGIGLEIGNSFYFYDDENQFSYFTCEEGAREVIIDLIQAGYIDCLHSYGDAAINRDQCLRALEVLYKTDCKLKVWINHYGAPSDFSRKFEYMFGGCRGDDPNSTVYHADVTLDYGIEFVWVGATTRVVGQSPGKRSSPLPTVFDPQYPARSFLSTLKEVRKNFLGQQGDERYIMQRQNQLVQPIRLKDGQQAHEFMRYGNHPISVSQGATSRGMAYMISKRNLEHLKVQQGFMIVYTHLGKNDDCQQVICEETQAALRNLEDEYREGQIYVTTTSKLLSYYLASQHVVWSHQKMEEYTRIDIHCLNDPVFGKKIPTIEQLQGLTFYVLDSSRVEVFIEGVKVSNLRRNPADELGLESVTLPRTYLNFPY